MTTKLLLLPVILPFIAGCCIALLPFRSGKIRNIFTFSAVLLNSVLSVFVILNRGGTLRLVQLTEKISVSLRCDGLSVVFLALIAFLWPLATLYSFEYMEKEENQPRFFGFYTMCFGITCGIALSANLLTMYLFYELLTLATIPLIAHEGDLRSQRAARKYIIYSLSGASLSFVGIMILLTYGSHGGFVFGGIRYVSSLSPEKIGRLLVGYMFTFLGFGVKSALVPFHAWLPTAGVAPTPVTALLHAVAVVKSGVFAVIRCTYYAFGPELLSGTWVQTTALVLSAITILFGSVMALREQHFKRRLAYSTVSNLSYILFGAACMTVGGLEAALSHMLFHAIMKITLFFCAGTVLCKTGREYTPDLEGLGRKMPLTFSVFLLASLALTGAPLLPGFISKMNLLKEAAKLSGGNGAVLFGMIALLLSALLTAAYLLPLSIRSFVPHSGAEPVFTGKDKDPGWRMLLPFAVLCASMIVFGCASSGLMTWLHALITEG